MNDARIRQSFNRAASTYAASATLQQQVADALLHQLGQTLPDNFAGRVLDAGCGTGYCLERLRQRFPATKLLGLDFAHAMLRQIDGDDSANASVPCINGDLETLPLADASIDLYFSSLAWQWCHLPPAMHEAARILKVGGDLWLTTLVAGTFHELHTVLKAAALTPAAHVLLPPQASTVCDAFSEVAHWRLIDAHCQAMTTWHPDFSALRLSIRGVGANRLPPAAHHENINRQTRQQLIAAYENLRTAQGLPLTYQVLTLHAQRI